MNKKKALCIFTIIMIFIQSIPVFAATVSVSDIDFTITVPDNLITATRNVSEGSRIVDLLGTDSAMLQTFYQQNNIYIDIIPEDVSYEILVTASPAEGIPDFSECAQDVLQGYIDNMYDTYANVTTEDIEDISLYQNSTTSYIVTKSHSIADEISVYIEKYYTVVNGMCYYITLQTNDFVIDDELSSMLKNMVDTISYADVKASITESPYFTELSEILIGGGLSIAVLLVILIIKDFSTRKPKTRN